MRTWDVELGTWTLTYFLTDHLGSTLAVLDASGTVLSQQRYLPFGKPRQIQGQSPITQTDFGYTFQRSLPDTGLMDYKARFYSQRLGRFIQPDNIVPGAANPQSWNRYSYVGNSPVNFSDPSGHMPDDGCNTEGCNLTQLQKGRDAQSQKRHEEEAARRKCEAGNSAYCAGDPLEIALFTLSMLTGGAALEAFILGGGAAALATSSLPVISKFFFPVAGNALYGSIASTLSYILISKLTGNQISGGGLAGAAVSGAIAGIVGTLATPLAGSLGKPLGIPSNIGSPLINGAGGLAAYYAGGNTSNAVNVQLGSVQSFQPSFIGAATSFVSSAALSSSASSSFPFQSINSLNQARHFIPGRTANTWLRPNNLHQQNIFAIIGGALLGDWAEGN